MPKRDITNRRQTTRMPVSMKAVDVESGTSFHTTDLSLDGVCLASKESHPIGSSLDLELLLPTGKPLRVRGVVAGSTSDRLHVSFKGLKRTEMVRIAESVF